MFQHLIKEGKDYVMEITLEDLQAWLKEHAQQVSQKSKEEIEMLSNKVNILEVCYEEENRSSSEWHGKYVNAINENNSLQQSIDLKDKALTIASNRGGELLNEIDQLKIENESLFKSHLAKDDLIISKDKELGELKYGIREIKSIARAMEDPLNALDSIITISDSLLTPST